MKTKPTLFDWKVDTPIKGAVMQALSAASTISGPSHEAIADELIKLLQLKLWIRGEDD